MKSNSVVQSWRENILTCRAGSMVKSQIVTEGNCPLTIYWAQQDKEKNIQWRHFHLGKVHLTPHVIISSVNTTSSLCLVFLFFFFKSENFQFMYIQFMPPVHKEAILVAQWCVTLHKGVHYICSNATLGRGLFRNQRRNNDGCDGPHPTEPSCWLLAYRSNQQLFWTRP